jgi:hypothetical protein
MQSAKLFFMFAGVLLVCAQLSFSQDAPKDQLFVIREEVARVDMWDKYESTSKQWVELMTEGGLDLPYVRASQQDDAHYLYLIPINSYADIDKFQSVFGSAIEKAGKEKWAKFLVENESCIVTHKDYVVRWSAEYSYIPKTPRLKVEDSKFIHWMYIRFKLEKRKELMAVLKEWKQLYESKNINSGYSIWQVEMGLDNDMIVLTEYFKDGADYYSTTKEVNAQVKAEEDVLWAKMAPLLVEVKQKHGNRRPDLSYIKK